MLIHVASEKNPSYLNEYDDKQVQPNAIDLKLDKVWKICNSVFQIDEGTKIHRQTEEMQPDEDGYFWLEPGTYEIVMQGEIYLAPESAGWVITRSTLNRNGIFITSGLYDSGYQGVMAGAMHVSSGPAKIKKGTRVGQFVMAIAEMMSEYDGDYGVGKQHDLKYQSGD